MARSEEGPGASVRQEWRQLVSGGGLFVAVLAILVLGAFRETVDTPTHSPVVAPLTRATPLPAEREVEPEPSALALPLPGAPARAGLDPLLKRTLEDPHRLAASAGQWTLQLAVACKRETASRLLDRAPASERLYVLPATVKDQECFRLCWGSYGSREEAERARDLPPSLRAGLDRPGARRISEMIP